MKDVFGRMNDKGFSLIELLVAIALASVITILAGSLIVTGTKLYNAEVAKADMQNDMQLANTKIEKALLEANSLKITKDGDVTYILTGEWDDASGSWTGASNPHGTAKAIIVKGDNIYVTDRYYSPAELESVDLKGYQVVSDLNPGSFNAEIMNAPVALSGGAVELHGPVSVKISYQVVGGGAVRSSEYEVVLRNSGVFDNVFGPLQSSDEYKEYDVK